MASLRIMISSQPSPINDILRSVYQRSTTNEAVPSRPNHDHYGHDVQPRRQFDHYVAHWVPSLVRVFFR